ncbi:TonB family protein [Duganella sp. sic0402]|uniref:TonB family protein n=1 Tax=Duganella sp. sic0402 TaxID=2854786 RepID=UPI001C45FBEA|nr:TonB family protein [Duganella sp. sic0402]MBV7537604.1 TonB family protein [Duganella sp. sic0402]
MSSATLSLRDAHAASSTASTAATRPEPSSLAVTVAGAGSVSYLHAGPRQHWLHRPGAIATLAIHGAALLAIWSWSSGEVRPPLAPPVIELIRIAPQPRPENTPPKPEPVREKQLALAPPKPVAQPLPTPKTVETTAAQAESYTPPPPPVQAAPPGPVTPPQPAPAPPAPAAAAAPKQITTEGIPTDYVNQVYARINRNADYPREAKMRRQQGKVGYRLTLNPDGTLAGFEIQSSGVEALDEAAREAIRRAAPYPRLPDLGGSSYLLAGNIVFKIN